MPSRGSSLTFYDRAECFEQVMRCHMECKLMTFSTRNIEHFVNQAREVVTLLDDGGDSSLAHCIRRRPLRYVHVEDFCKTHQHGHGCTQFVAGNRKKGLFLLLDTFLTSDILKDESSSRN